jgi:hypothetical protein
VQGFQNPAAAPSGGRQPFNKTELIQLLKLETPNSLLLPQIRSAGIDFVATQDDLEKLAKMGASEAILAVIREASGRLKVAQDEATIREAEVLFWRGVIKHPEIYALRSYLRHFPDGPNASVARHRIDEMRREKESEGIMSDVRNGPKKTLPLQEQPATPVAHQMPFAAQQRGSLELSELELLVSLQTPDTVLTSRIEALGVAPSVTEESLALLRGLGASSAVLEAVRGATQRSDAECTPATDLQLWRLTLNDMDLTADPPIKEPELRYLKQCPQGMFVDLAREQFIERRATELDDSFKGDLIANVIATRESNEDAIIGRQQRDTYFKATDEGWSILDNKGLADLPHDVRDDLDMNIDRPLVWLVNRSHLLKEKEYETHYKSICYYTRIALFGSNVGRIVTLFNPFIPKDEYIHSNGKSVPAARLASLNLSPPPIEHAISDRTRKNFRDRGEYELFSGLTKETDPGKKRDLLTTWKYKYPDSDFRRERLQLLLATYEQLVQPVKVIDTAREMLAIDSEDITSLYWITFLTPSLGGTSPDTLDTVEKSAKGLLAAEARRNGQDEEWTRAKTDATAYTALGWIAMQRKNNEVAEDNFKKCLAISPTASQVSYWLGTVILAENKPEKQSEALYYFARAAAYDGPGGLTLFDERRTKSEVYLTELYNRLHGDSSGLAELKAQARVNATPPADFKINALVDHGDFSYKTSTTTASASESQTTPPVSSYYFSRDKMRVDTGNTSTIIDFAARTTTSINNISKTYAVRNFAGLSATAAARDLDGTPPYWFGPRPKITMKQTRQKRIASGFNATEVLVTIEGLHHQKRKIEMEIEMWVSPDIPGGWKLREFYKRNAGNVPQIVMGFPWDAMLGAVSSGARAALVDAQRTMASMNGVILEQTVRVKEGNRWHRFPPMHCSEFSARNIPDSVFGIPAGYQRRALNVPR